MASQALTKVTPLKLIAPTRVDWEDEDEDGKRIERMFIAPAEDKAWWFARLDATGIMAVLTLVAWGHQPAAIAIKNEIPVLWFQEWFEQRAKDIDVKRAERVAAQMLVTQSIATLDVQAANQPDATMRKEYSARLAWAAERLDADKWGNAKDRGEPLRPVVLNLNFGHGKVTKVIDARPTPLQIEEAE